MTVPTTPLPPPTYITDYHPQISLLIAVDFSELRVHARPRGHPEHAHRSALISFKFDLIK